MHDHPSSISEALTTELLEAPWRAGSKLNHNYTSRWSFDNCNKDPKGDQSGRGEGFISLPICFWLKILAFRPGCVRGRTSRSSVVNKELVSSQLTLHWLSVATYLSTLWFVILKWTRVALVSWPIRPINLNTQTHFTAVPYWLLCLIPSSSLHCYYSLCDSPHTNNYCLGFTAVSSHPFCGLLCASLSQT